MKTLEVDAGREALWSAALGAALDCRRLMIPKAVHSTALQIDSRASFGLYGRVLSVLVFVFFVIGQLPAVEAADPTGFVRVEQIDGAWWFVSPDGEPFFSTGVNHAAQANYWLQPYNREATLKRFGKAFLSIYSHPETAVAEKWVRAIESRMKQWHFNSFGMHSKSAHPEIIDPVFYYTAELHLMKYHTNMKPGDEWPDVFSQEFEGLVDAEAGKVCGQNRDKPNLLGYYFTDEPAWTNFFRRLPEGNDWWFYFSPWVDAMRRLPAAAPGKKAWIASLRENYDSAVAAARTYGVQADGWDALAGRTEWVVPEKSGSLTRDVDTMLARIAERWYTVQHDAIRRYDANHLILGDKHRHTVPDWLFPILKRTVDVVVIQRYGDFSEWAPHVLDIYRATGKPVLSGDGNPDYRGAQKTGLKGGLYVAKTYDEEKMGALYAEHLEDLASTPHVVGFHHCGFIETWGTPERKGYAIRSGFIDPFGKPYEIFTSRVCEANKRANEWHHGSRVRSSEPN